MNQLNPNTSHCEPRDAATLAEPQSTLGQAIINLARIAADEHRRQQAQRQGLDHRSPAAGSSNGDASFNAPDQPDSPTTPEPRPFSRRASSRPHNALARFAHHDLAYHDNASAGHDDAFDGTDPGPSSNHDAGPGYSHVSELERILLEGGPR